MTPTKQTVLHDPANGLHGNCLSAVLASLLHLPIDEVPLFITPDTWVKDLMEWSSAEIKPEEGGGRCVFAVTRRMGCGQVRA